MNILYDSLSSRKLTNEHVFTFQSWIFTTYNFNCSLDIDIYIYTKELWSSKHIYQGMRGTHKWREIRCLSLTPCSKNHIDPRKKLHWRKGGQLPPSPLQILRKITDIIHCKQGQSLEEGKIYRGEGLSWLLLEHEERTRSI